MHSNWKTSRKTQMLLSVAAGASLALFVATILATAQSGRGEPPNRPQQVDGSELAKPTPSLLAAAGADEAGVLARFRELAPDAANTLEMILKGDTEGVASKLPVSTAPCEAWSRRGFDACADVKVAPGTEVTRYALETDPPPYFAPEATVREALKHLLVGRNPELGMLAQGSDGSWLATVLVSPAAPFDLPGGIGNGPNRITRLQARFSPDQSLAALNQHSDSTPPLETVRFNERNSGISYEIVFASARFRETEDAYHRATMDGVNSN